MQITLRSHSFVISEPYQPGQVITELEAAILNQSRMVNIKKAILREMDKKKTDKMGFIQDQALQDLREFVANLDETYKFEFFPSTQSAPASLEDEISAIAMAEAEAYAIKTGGEFSPQLFEQLKQSQGVKERAKERFVAAKSLLRKSLSLEDL